MTVTLDWLGCATFRLVVPDGKGGETVVFLDAYIDRVPSAPPTGFTVSDIDRADWIVIGHSHFDHLWGAERIARATGAKIIGTHETVRVMEQQGVPMSQLHATSGGDRFRLAENLIVGAYPSQHSCVWAHKEFPESDAVCIGDLGLLYDERHARIAELLEFIRGLNDEVKEHFRVSDQQVRGDGGSLAFLFDMPQGRLFFQDTSGHWTGIMRDLRPDVAILAAAGRGNIDGEPIQGTLAQFVAREADLLRPRKIVLGHHDDWLPGFTKPFDLEPVRHELARAVPDSTLHEIGYASSWPVFE